MTSSQRWARTVAIPDAGASPSRDIRRRVLVALADDVAGQLDGPTPIDADVLGEQTGLSPMTVRRALGKLDDAGLISTKRVTLDLVTVLDPTTVRHHEILADADEALAAVFYPGISA